MKQDGTDKVLDLFVNAAQQSAEHGGVESGPNCSLYRVIAHTEVTGELQGCSDNLRGFLY